MHPQKRHSYYRADEDGLIYLKVAKGDKAEIDKLDTKMEIDHNFEHQESINGIFGKDAPVPEGVPENWWRKYADQYTDDGEVSNWQFGNVVL